MSDSIAAAMAQLPSPPVQHGDIELLLQVFPQLDRELAHDLLLACSGDRRAAVQLILELDGDADKLRHEADGRLRGTREYADDSSASSSIAATSSPPPPAAAAADVPTAGRYGERLSVNNIAASSRGRATAAEEDSARLAEVSVLEVLFPSVEFDVLVAIYTEDAKRSLDEAARVLSLLIKRSTSTAASAVAASPTAAVSWEDDAYWDDGNDEGDSGSAATSPSSLAVVTAAGGHRRAIASSPPTWEDDAFWDPQPTKPSSTTRRVAATAAATNATKKNVWRARDSDGLAAPDKLLRVDRLAAMFPELDRAAVEAALRPSVSAGDWDRAVEVLRWVTENSSSAGVVGMDARERLGRRATQHRVGEAAKKGRLPPSPPPLTQPASSAAATTASVAAAAAAARRRQNNASPVTVPSAPCCQPDEPPPVEDWRRTRQEAYMVNAARAQVVAHAVQAYARQQHDVGKQLLRKSQELKRRYERLNMLAMHALEAERTAQHGVTILDLHGFHVAEALEVLRRRVERCTREGCGALTVVTGKGNHSKHGKSVLRPAVIAWAEERTDVKVREVSPAEIELGIVAPRRRR